MTPPATPLRGRCLCGAVTFEVDPPLNWTGHCHCESCRRQTSSPMTSFFGVNTERARWTGAAPAVYASSPGVSRMFCANCGAPMAYHSEAFAHETHFYVASLEDPRVLAPDQHFHYGEKLPWLEIGDHLVKHHAGAG
ncbi:MAG: GFA family protein [Pseudomonadota bacterium]